MVIDQPHLKIVLTRRTLFPVVISKVSGHLSREIILLNQVGIADLDATDVHFLISLQIVIVTVVVK